jgi:hypothetical protein
MIDVRREAGCWNVQRAQPWTGSDWNPIAGAPNLLSAINVWAFSPTDDWASPQSDVWAVRDDAIEAHYDGASWGRTIAGSALKSSIWGSGPSDIYALSTFDLVDYDGDSWTDVAHQKIGAPNLRLFLAMHGTSSTRHLGGWATARGGRIHGADLSLPALIGVGLSPHEHDRPGPRCSAST